MNAIKKRDPGTMLAVIALLLLFLGWFKGMKSAPSKPVFVPLDLKVKGLPEGLKLRTVYEKPSEAARAGQKVFDQYCIGCHGVNGSGDGLAASYLDPKPRNLNSGIFKFITSQRGTLPIRGDLMKTVTEGLPGSSMPSFRLLPERARKDVVEFVLHLARNGRYWRILNALVTEAIHDADEDDPFTKDVLKEVLEDNADILLVKEAVAMFPETSEQAISEQSLVTGRLFFAQYCNSCHGLDGLGLPMLTAEGKAQLDDFGEASRPRDLTRGRFRHGTDSLSLWYRIKRGLDGAVMPAAGNWSSDQAWHVAHYTKLLFDQDLQQMYPLKVVNAKADVQRLPKLIAQAKESIERARYEAQKSIYKTQIKKLMWQLKKAQQVLNENN
jgi:mono/diheme cytochrome c family protein